MPNEVQSWRAYVARLTAAAKFNPPADRAEIASAEEVLGMRLPAELASILQESNGLTGDYGVRLLWSVQQIKDENVNFRSSVAFRELYMPFDCLLFFSDAGNGDQFAYVVLGGEVRRRDIFVWDHESDSRNWAAPSLKVFYDWRLTGKLKI